MNTTDMRDGADCSRRNFFRITATGVAVAEPAAELAVFEEILVSIGKLTNK
jgi:hypothetical protein